jgi:hypothetical protein
LKPGDLVEIDQMFEAYAFGGADPPGSDYILTGVLIESRDVEFDDGLWDTVWSVLVMGQVHDVLIQDINKVISPEIEQKQ